MYLRIFFICSLFMVCSGQQCSTKENCNTPATVVDRSDLDGCTWLLELENGDRLIPQFPEGGKPDFKLKDGMQVSINYKLNPEVMTICMAGKVAMISCIEKR